MASVDLQARRHDGDGHGERKTAPLPKESCTFDQLP